MAKDDTKIPNNHVIGVIHGDSAAESAVQELERIGYGDADLLRGWEARKKIDVQGEDSNPVVSLVKSLAGHLSDQVAYLQQYEEAAEQGDKLLAVKVEDRDHARRVADVMQRYGAVNVRFFGKLAVSDMSPATNPSAPSDLRP